MITKYLLLFLILTIPLNGIPKTNDTVPVTIPFRISNKKIGPSGLLLKDLQLYINKKRVKTDLLSGKERWISKETILGRNFIISFRDFTKYEQVLSNGLSYFITDILNTSDSLIIHTPYNIYPVKVTKNKEKIIFNIEKILEGDIKKIVKEMTPTLKGIQNEISLLKQYFNSYDPENPHIGAAYYLQFLSKITLDIQFFRNHFLVPDKKRFAKVHEHMGNREGDRYWIYIQNGELYPFNKKLEDVLKQIRFHTAVQALNQGSWKTVIDSNIKTLDETMLLSKLFPANKLQQQFADTNTTFFVLILNTGKTVKTKTSLIKLDLKKILEKISGVSGGNTLETGDMEAGLRTIKEHKDKYFELEYSAKRTPEDKNISLRYKNEKKILSHRKRYSKKEFSELIKNLTDEKLKFKLLSIKNNLISFSITSYAIQKKEKFGLLKVYIQILNSEDSEVYRSSNTLRATKKKINISTGLPKNLSGELVINISVHDLISNRFVKASQKIIL